MADEEQSELSPCFMRFPAVVQTILAHQKCYGEDSADRAANQLIEEMAELTVEIQHSRRGRKAEIEVEIVDVLIVLEILCDAMGLNRAALEMMVTSKAEIVTRRIDELYSVNDPEQEGS